MNNLLYKIILIWFFIFSFNNVFSLTETDALEKIHTVIIKMNNGDEYKGQILKKDKEIIVLKTEIGEISIVSSNVKFIKRNNYRRRRFKFDNPNDTRYFFGPSGFPIKKGKGYYQNIMVTSNFANYGISENISIGGGFEFLSLVYGHPIWFLTPKVGFNISEYIHVGGGIIMVGFATEFTATLGYGVLTLGHSDSNFSIGAGYGFIGGQFSKYPSIMFSGTHRVKNNLALLSENYVIPSASGDAGYIGIHGLRILSKKNSFDIGLIVIPEIADIFPVIPYVGYVRVF